MSSSGARTTSTERRDSRRDGTFKRPKGTQPMAKTPDTVASLVKRGSPSAWPHELEVVDDPSDPFFDDRNELPVSDERIRNFVLVGQVQPISVKLRGGRLLVNAGRQRWKR